MMSELPKRWKFKTEIRGPISYMDGQYDLWYTTNGFHGYSHAFLVGELEEIHTVIGKFLEEQKK